MATTKTEMTDELLAAMQDLAQEPDPTYKRGAMESITNFNRVLPVRFAGALAVLNPLVDLALANPPEFDRIALLIEARRSQAGLPMMWPPAEPEKFNRTASQRVLMRERRARSNRALTYENTMRRKGDQLYGSARLTFENHVLRKWGHALEDQLADARRRNGGRLSQEVTARLRAAFWQKVDAELDEQETKLRASGLLQPPSRSEHRDNPISQ